MSLQFGKHEGRLSLVLPQETFFSLEKLSTRQTKTTEDSDFIDISSGLAPGEADGLPAAKERIEVILEKLSPSALAESLICENPQTIAAVLSFAKAPMLAATLEKLGPIETETALRIAYLGSIAADVMPLIEKLLEKAVAHQAALSLCPEGVSKMIAVVAAMDLSRRESFLAQLEERDQELVAVIRHCLSAGELVNRDNNSY